jgi:hypothetical protein
MIDVPDGGLAGIFAGLMGLRRGVDAALCLLAQGFAGIVAGLLRGLFLRSADVDAIGIAADPGEAGGQREPGEGPLLHALDQNGDGQSAAAVSRALTGAGAVQRVAAPRRRPCPP